MTPPPGYYESTNQVCKLSKSIYGLKQASRQWFAKLAQELLFLGYYQSKNDYSLFIKKQANDMTFIAIYVDDIIVTGNNPIEVTKVKEHLDSTFSIKDLGRLNYFLGIEVTYAKDGLVLHQHKYTRELLSESGITNFKRVVTPLPLHLKLSAHEGSLLPDATPYRSIIGKLNYLTNTRPDLSYTVQTLSQYMQQPRDSHWEALQHTLNYIHSTCGQGIILSADAHITLQAFSDSDWASCVDTRRSITGYILLLGKSPVSWKSKKQATVSKSSSEAEYRAMAAAAAEVTWIVRLLTELGVNNLKPITLHCDNQSSLYIAKNPVFHDRTKHIEVDCHFTRDKVLEGLLQLSYLPTRHQLADILTKILPSAPFNELISKLGMSKPLPSLRGDVEDSAVD